MVKKIIMNIEEIINDAELLHAFSGTNFGKIPNRDVVKYSLLKYASGYRTGHTAMVILQELGLITNKCNLTKKGKEYLFWSFYAGHSM